MASVILAGTTSTTALNLTGDTSGELQLKTNNGSTTAMTLTTAGNVGIGTSSPTTVLDVVGNTRFYRETDAVAQFTFSSYAATASNRPQINIDRYKGTAASPTTVTNGDVLGWVNYRGYDGTTILNAATIRALVTGAVSTNVLPTDLAFYTNGGGSNVTERMRINSAGEVAIAGTSYAVLGYEKLNVFGSGGFKSSGTNALGLWNTANSGLLTFYTGAGVNAGTITSSGSDLTLTGGTNLNLTAAGANYITLNTNSTERMRITSGGNVGIGTSSPSSNLVVNSSTATQFDLLTNGTRYFSAYTDTSQVILGGIQNTIVSFRQNDTERMQLDTSGNLRFNSGYGSVATAYGCRAWVNFNGTGTPAINASGNVSSIGDLGTGHYTVNFTTSLPDTNYVVFMSADISGWATGRMQMAGFNTSGYQIRFWNSSGTETDPPLVNSAAIR